MLFLPHFYVKIFHRRHRLFMPVVFLFFTKERTLSFPTPFYFPPEEKRFPSRGRKISLPTPILLHISCTLPLQRRNCKPFLSFSNVFSRINLAFHPLKRTFALILYHSGGQKDFYRKGVIEIIFLTQTSQL